MRQAQKMEAVGQLTGGLAHDFNNMLAGISGGLQMIRIRVSQGRTAELDPYIDAALIAVNRAAALTHRLLAFSRRQVLDPKAIDVNQLIGNMEELFRRTVGPGISVETRPAPELWATLCDPNQLENALLNLVINARDAMPDGGHLLIETSNTAAGFPSPQWAPNADAALSDHHPHEYIALVISDTGTGMSPDVIARAFDPFFTTKALGEGTGLGLSMVYGFVQQSGGHVQLRSENGQGTAVTVFLPRHLGTAEGEVQAAESADLSPVEKSVAVLVVEDEPAVRMIIVELLSDRGYTVLEAHSGRSGLNILQSGARIDLLLTDVGLPGGMNGRQLADAARELRPGLKVLFLTGYAESSAVRNGRMEPGTEVMTKPFELAVLAARVQDMISG
jgi:nitrogen-specific signal transduction histidine kinase